MCGNVACAVRFVRIKSDISANNFCSRSCAAVVNNRQYPKRIGAVKSCGYHLCGAKFRGRRKFCSNLCYLCSRHRYTKDEVLKKISEFFNVYGYSPNRRQTRLIEPAALFYFKSWNNAIRAAGVIPNRSCDNRMYQRITTKASDGHSCDSTSEAIIDDWLSENGIPHTRNARYPTTGHRADWLIKGRDREYFIEYFGLKNDCARYDKNIQLKRSLCKASDIPLIEIWPADLYPKINLLGKLGMFVSR